MLGLPLRLLAREVYDRVSARIGEQAVALVTGEEKRIPARARYFICTVEAMPRVPTAFLAVDEIQLMAHRERGHVFTDRLLHWRGERETWFLGSDTVGSARARVASAAAHRAVAALVAAPRCRAGVGPQPTAAKCRHRIQHATGLRARGPVASSAWWGCGRDGCAVAARSQRPGLDVPSGRGRLPRRDRCDRYGVEPGSRPRRARGAHQVRWAGDAGSRRRRARTDRRSRRPVHARRHVRHARSVAAVGAERRAAVGVAPVSRASNRVLPERGARHVQLGWAARELDAVAAASRVARGPGGG